MAAGRKRQDNLPVAQYGLGDDVVDLTEIEDSELRLAYSELSAVQLQAIRMEVGGIIDRNLIAKQLGLENPNIITKWRSLPLYKKVREINLRLIDNANRKFRANCVKQIIIPAYAELIKRMSDQTYLDNIATKDLVDIIGKMTREIRLDSITALPADKDNELADLQRRRELVRNTSNDVIEGNSNIVELPMLRTANG